MGPWWKLLPGGAHRWQITSSEDLKIAVQALCAAEETEEPREYFATRWGEMARDDARSLEDPFDIIWSKKYTYLVKLFLFVLRLMAFGCFWNMTCMYYVANFWAPGRIHTSRVRPCFYAGLKWDRGTWETNHWLWCVWLTGHFQNSESVLPTCPM